MPDDGKRHYERDDLPYAMAAVFHAMQTGIGEALKVRFEITECLPAKLSSLVQRIGLIERQEGRNNPSRRKNLNGQR
jgi:hypothetical protein